MPHNSPSQPKLGRDMALCFSLLFALGMLLNFVYDRARSTARSDVCLENVSRQSRALLQYATDYDSHFPPAPRWQTAMGHYLTHPLTSCPETPRGPTAGLGYAMNGSQDGAVQGAKTQEILLFETSSLVLNAHDRGESFAPRHGTSTSRLRKSWVSFGDGHTKLLSTDEFKTAIRPVN